MGGIMKRKSVPIIITSLLLGFAFDWLFYGKLPGISVFIFTSLILGFTFYLANKFRQPLNKSLYWLAPVILFFSFMLFVRANPFLMVMNIFIVIFLLLLAVRLSHQPGLNLRQYEIFQYVSQVAGMPLRIINESLHFLLGLIGNRTIAASKPSKSSAAPIIRGVLLSLPVLVLFLILLSSADLVFKQFVGSLFNPSISPETVFRLGLIGFVASFCAGASALIFMPSSVPDTNQTPDRIRFNIGTTESSVILGSVSLLFFVFVIVQFAYLFGGANHIASTGHTYAEYARKGFFELIAVAALSLLLIMAVKKATVFRTAPTTLVFKWLSGVLIAEVMVIMLSAHMRLNLYEDAYGFTTLRLLSHLFILWLAFAFLMLFVNIVRGKSDQRFAFQVFISLLCFFALINIINPDNFIARQNINRFNRVGKIDLYYLSNLSEDAAPTIAGLLKHPNQNLQKSAANILYKQERRMDSISDHWQSANLSRQRAKRIFRSNAAQIEAGKPYDEYPELDAE